MLSAFEVLGLWVLHLEFELGLVLYCRDAALLGEYGLSPFATYNEQDRYSS